jgi:hypothetical protein
VLTEGEGPTLPNSAFPFYLPSGSPIFIFINEW